jgi:hypothetical protein
MKELRKLGNHKCTTKILEEETAMGTGLVYKNVTVTEISCNIKSSCFKNLASPYS